MHRREAITVQKWQWQLFFQKQLLLPSGHYVAFEHAIEHCEDFEAAVEGNENEH